MTYPEDWSDRIQSIRDRDGFKCSFCGRMNLELHVHHITPLSKGGSNDPTNLTTICADCHRKMHEHNNTEHEEMISSGFFCLNCNRFYSVDYGRKHERCDVCGTILRSWFVDKKD